MPLRLDQLVAQKFALSRRAAQEAIRNGRVELAGERCDEPGRAVEPDDPVEFFPNRPRARKVETRLNLLFEDRHLILVEKPPGILSVPTADRESGTLLERVSRYLTIRYGGRPYVGVIHRLDKETSGVMAMARTPEALRTLQEQFRDHSIEREYLAVVEGRLSKDRGTIDVPLVTEGGEARRRIARGPGEGKPAVTHYRVVERFDTVATVLACWLETGRTHQIRLHMASIGHPVVGDKVYRPRKRPPSQARFRRQALHARTLGLLHPATGEPVRAEAPPPGDLLAMIDALRHKFGSG